MLPEQHRQVEGEIHLLVILPQFITILNVLHAMTRTPNSTLSVDIIMTSCHSLPPTPCIASFHLSNVKHDIPIWWLIYLNIFFSSFNLFVGKTVFYISVFWYQLLEIQTLSWVSLEILQGCFPRRKHLDNLPDHEKHKIGCCGYTHGHPHFPH